MTIKNVWGISSFAAFVAVIWWSIHTESWWMIPVILFGLTVTDIVGILFFDE